MEKVFVISKGTENGMFFSFKVKGGGVAVKDGLTIISDPTDSFIVATIPREFIVYEESSKAE